MSRGGKNGADRFLDPTLLEVTGLWADVPSDYLEDLDRLDEPDELLERVVTT
jgi:hypothetical protein